MVASYALLGLAAVAQVACALAPKVVVHFAPKHGVHRNGRGHPENPGRLDEICVPALRRLGPGVSRVEVRRGRLDAEDAALRVHDAAHVERVKGASRRLWGRTRLGPDTFAKRGSHGALLRSLSLWLDAVDGALARRDGGEGGVEFALSRPPGHHASRHAADGFCVYNFAAAAAAYALDAEDVDWVAVLDWDAHHGNGVAAFADEDPRVCYASAHQAPLWPNTGDDESDRGCHGNRLSATVGRGCGPEAYEAAWRRCVEFCRAFGDARGGLGRGLVIVSAGFDASDSGQERGDSTSLQRGNL